MTLIIMQIPPDSYFSPSLNLKCSSQHICSQNLAVYVQAN